MNKGFIIGGAVSLMALLGLVVWYSNKQRNAREFNLEPSTGIDPNEVIAPGPDLSEDGSPAQTTEPSNTDSILISAHSGTARAAISKRAEYFELTDRLNLKIRERYEIGSRLFDGIPEQQREAFYSSFERFINGLDGQNYLEYPIEGQYSNPQLEQELRTIAQRHPDGIPTAGLREMTPSTDIFYLKSIGYNVLTGELDPTPNSFSYDIERYIKLTNTFTSKARLAKTTLRFVKNWLSEISRFNKAVELEAINSLLREGWRFKEYSAPTTQDLG